MIVLVSYRWSNHIKNWWAEPSGFGLAGAVTLSGTTQTITVIGTYWPFQSNSNTQLSGSLWNQLKQTYLNRIHYIGSSRDYIKDQIGYISTKWLSKPYSTCILGGDLNSKFTSTESGSGTIP